MNSIHAKTIERKYGQRRQHRPEGPTTKQKRKSGWSTGAQQSRKPIVSSDGTGTDEQRAELEAGLAAIHAVRDTLRTYTDSEWSASGKKKNLSEAAEGDEDKKGHATERNDKALQREQRQKTAASGAKKGEALQEQEHWSEQDKGKMQILQS